MTASRLLFDSSAWLSYFFNESGQVVALVAHDKLFTSVLSFYEIKRKLIRHQFPSSKIAKVLDFIQQRSIVVRLDRVVCEQAVENAKRYNLHAMDALLYTSARQQHCVFVTGDADFKKCKDVLHL